MSASPVLFHYPLTIKEHHLDTFGHVNNATYLALLEEARWEFITQRGFGMQTIQATACGPVVLEIHMKFIKELRLRDAIEIQTQLIDYKGKVGTLLQIILNEQKERCFEATLHFGLMDTKARKLIPPTPEWYYAVGYETT